MTSKVALLMLAIIGVVQAQVPGPKSQVPSQWQQAAPGYEFVFPRDHAAHPDNKIEWWYYTGNVKTAEGRRFGFQVTFFRVGIDYKPANPSQWAVRDLYMTHLAVSDAKGQRYRFAEKLSRGGPGLAGARSDRYYVWNDDWSAGIKEPGAGSRTPDTGGDGPRRLCRRGALTVRQATRRLRCV